MLRVASEPTPRSWGKKTNIYLKLYSHQQQTNNKYRQLLTSLLYLSTRDRSGKVTWKIRWFHGFWWDSKEDLSKRLFLLNQRQVSVIELQVELKNVRYLMSPPRGWTIDPMYQIAKPDQSEASIIINFFSRHFNTQFSSLSHKIEYNILVIHLHFTFLHYW